MERKIIEDKNYIIGYHTQEFRVEGELELPIICRAKDAWLGIGYYFWVDVEFAKYWGEDYKMATGSYDVYTADLQSDNFLNTVFNEEHYFAFRKWIAAAIADLNSKHKKLTLKKVHEFLSDNFWSQMGIDGIIYDDMPTNPKNKPKRKYSVVIHSEAKQDRFFYYHKRIQIVAFNLKNINNFALYLEDQN